VVVLKRLLGVLFCFFLLCPVVARGEAGTVALTFDDGPSGRFTRALLDGLEQRQVKATFLLCGYRLKDYPKEAERILKSGHEIGLHGYSHDAMNKMSRRQLEQEIRDNLARLPRGCKPVFLRPPGGAVSQTVRDTARDMGFGILNWSVDPRDWATRDAGAITAMVLDNVRDGDVILLHDMTDSSVEAALEIIDRLKAQGFRFVTVTELARLKGVTIEPGKEYFKFG
jgi:peptidoglycan/xylan/chitin deacetylase (PgdA/CDA1 family)